MSCLSDNKMNAYIIEEEGEDFDAVMEIYDRLFPATEKIPHEVLLQIAKNEKGELKVYKENGALCGFTFIAKDEFFSYLMFFAVNDSLHSKGYGSKIVQQFKEMNLDRPIIFAIEDPDEEGAENLTQRIRRRAFYMKNGFEFTGTKMASSEAKLLLFGTTKDVKSVYAKSILFQTIVTNGGFELSF